MNYVFFNRYKNEYLLNIYYTYFLLFITSKILLIALPNLLLILCSYNKVFIFISEIVRGISIAKSESRYASSPE